MYRKLALLSCVFVVLYSFGCATGPDLGQELAQSGKTFEERFPLKIGTANVFVHRDAEMMGAALPMEIYFDGNLAGRLWGDSFVVINSNPGDHTLETSFNKEPLSLHVDVGQNYFIRIEAARHPWSDFSGREARNLILGSHFRGVLDATKIAPLDKRFSDATREAVDKPKQNKPSTSKK